MPYDTLEGTAQHVLARASNPLHSCPAGYAKRLLGPTDF